MGNKTDEVESIVPPAEVSQALLELQEAYAGALPGLVAQLSGAAAEARLEGEAGEGLETLRMLSHRLRGTAGSYGFMEVSRAAAELEEVVRQLAEMPGDALWARVDALLGEMERAGRR